MMHRAWSSIVEVPYSFSRSYVKFQGHTALKIVEFDPNWAFPDSNSSLNSPMAMKCCTKLETAKERCPIVFQGHPSNFKVTQDKTSPILTQIGRFRTIGRSQLSNPSDLPCCRQKPFFPSFCEKPFLAFFSSLVFIIAPKCPFQSLCLQKIPGGGPPDPLLWKGKFCRTYHIYRIGAHHGTVHRFVPSCLTQKFSVKIKMLKNTNLWLKP